MILWPALCSLRSAAYAPGRIGPISGKYAEGVSVGTIEHLMGALSGFGITNAVIEIDGPEVPILDGSAEDYVTLFECAGVMEQEAPLKVLRVLKDVCFDDGKGAKVCLYPADKGFSLDFMIEFPQSKAIGHQEYSIEMGLKNFKNDIAYARTFGFAKEVEMLRSMGLARGGSLENAIVVEGSIASINLLVEAMASSCSLSSSRSFFTSTSAGQHAACCWTWSR